MQFSLGGALQKSGFASGVGSPRWGASFVWKGSASRLLADTLVIEAMARGGAGVSADCDERIGYAELELVELNLAELRDGGLELGQRVVQLSRGGFVTLLFDWAPALRAGMDADQAATVVQRAMRRLAARKEVRHMRDEAARLARFPPAPPLSPRSMGLKLDPPKPTPREDGTAEKYYRTHINCARSSPSRSPSPSYCPSMPVVRVRGRLGCCLEPAIPIALLLI